MKDTIWVQVLPLNFKCDKLSEWWNWLNFVLYIFFLLFLQALGLKRDDTFSVTMLGHCIEMYIGDTDAYIGRIQFTYTVVKQGSWFDWIIFLWRPWTEVRIQRLQFYFVPFSPWLFIRQTGLDDCICLLYYCCHLSPCRHRHQWQVAGQLKYSSIDENAEHIRVWRPCHTQNGRGEWHLLGNATVWSGQDDARDTPANPGVWHVWEWCDARHFVRHQHVISSC